MFKWIKYIEFLNFKTTGFEIIRIGGIFKNKSLFSIHHSSGKLYVDIFYLPILKGISINKKWAFDIIRFIPLIALYLLYDANKVSKDVLIFYLAFFVIMIFFTDIKEKKEHR